MWSWSKFRQTSWREEPEEGGRWGRERASKGREVGSQIPHRGGKVSPRSPARDRTAWPGRWARGGRAPRASAPSHGLQHAAEPAPQHGFEPSSCPCAWGCYGAWLSAAAGLGPPGPCGAAFPSSQAEPPVPRAEAQPRCGLRHGRHKESETSVSVKLERDGRQSCTHRLASSSLVTPGILPQGSRGWARGRRQRRRDVGVSAASRPGCGPRPS
jgi:hypothetical protein